MIKILYYIVKYIRLAGKFIGLPLFIVFIYLSFTKKWDAFAEETSIVYGDAVLLYFMFLTLLSCLIYLRGGDYEYYLSRKHWNSKIRK